MGMKNDYRLKIKDFRLKFLLLLIILLINFLFINNLPSQPVKIGVALPLFEDSEDESIKQLGTDILSGINNALSEHNIISSIKVTLVIRDTKKDIETCVNIFTELAENDTIKCILGPVYSSELTEVMDIGFINKIPIVSPTATGDDLAETNDYIFQLNPSYKVRGKLMARYLMKELRMMLIR